MSVRALSWSFSLPLQDMAAKGVLHALADHADEDWKCWPSLARIALFVGCSENTARRALQRVEAMGIISRVARPGQSDLYRLNADFDPSQIGTPAKSEPLPTETPPLPTRHPTPPMVGPEPSKNRQPNRQRGDGARGTRLQDDWMPSAEDRAFAADHGLDPDSAADEFRDYWTAVPGSRGLKLDWSKTFRNRVREVAARRPAGGRAKPADTLPISRDGDGQWAARVRGWTPGRFWNRGDWGPPPNEPGCRAPSHLITQWRPETLQ